VSKRSFRRFAVVAGAALALGSMAPAMAQRVDVSGVADVDVSVDGLGTPGAGAADVSYLTGLLSYPGLNSTLLTVGGIGIGTVGTAGGVVLGTAGIAGGTVLGTAGIAGGTVLGTAGIAGAAVNNTVNKVTGLGILNGDGLLECGLVNVQSCNQGGNHDINILGGGPGLGADGLGSILDPQVGVVAAVFASL
jgi:hypothetical protein